MSPQRELLIKRSDAEVWVGCGVDVSGCDGNKRRGGWFPWRHAGAGGGEVAPGL